MLPAPDIQPIVYFFTNSLAVIASAAVLFFALGVTYGWMTWAKFKRRARAFQEETDLLRHEIARLKRQIADQSMGANSHTRALTEPEPTPSLPQQPVEQFQPPVEQKQTADLAQAAAAKAEPTLPAPTEVPSSAPVAIPSEDSKFLVHGPRKESLAQALLGASHNTHAPAAPPDEVLTESNPEPPLAPGSVTQPAHELGANPAMSAEIDAVRQPSAKVPNETIIVDAVIEKVPEPSLSAPLPVAPPEAILVPVADTIVEPKKNGHPVTPATLAFAAELEGGLVEFSTETGIRYHKRPDRWDDLTLLRGVAETLQERLHEHGVFTFKQIALWSDDQAKGMAERISAKDRIQRDRWVQQATDLHYLKYGEKLI